MAVCRYDPRVAAAAFVPHPEPAYSSSMNERTLRKSAAPGYTTSGAYTGPVSTVFGAFKQKSVKHRRNDGSNVGPEVQVPRPPPVSPVFICSCVVCLMIRVQEVCRCIYRFCLNFT